MSAHYRERTGGESHSIHVCKLLSPLGCIHHVDTPIPKGSVLGGPGGLSLADSVAMLSHVPCRDPLSSSACYLDGKAILIACVTQQVLTGDTRGTQRFPGYEDTMEWKSQTSPMYPGLLWETKKLNM